MNHLSWLLYCADVLPSLKVGVVMTSVIGAMMLLLVWLIGMGMTQDSALSPTQSKKICKIPYIIVSLITLALLTNLIPSRQTFYLIAGSEMSEQMIKTPELQKVQDLVNIYLDNAIKHQKEFGGDKENR